MLFDSNLLFWHATSAYQYTAGEFVSLVGTTGTTTSSVIDLGVARDLGIDGGVNEPKLAMFIGTGITSSSSSMLIEAQFQGSTNSTLWTTYLSSGALSTASYAAGAVVLPFNVPRRPTGAGLPRYYRVQLIVSGTGGTPGISTGTIVGGIVLTRGDVDTFNQYSAGYSFPSAG